MKQTTNFPYNVIIDSKSELKIENANDLNNYCYSLEIPKSILEDIIFEKENIELIAEVNCSSTMYRECFKSESLEKISIKIDKKNIFKTFNIDVLIVFNIDTDFDNVRLREGMPYAHLGSFKVETETATQSLISFIPNEKDEYIHYSFTDHAIKIKIPKTKYDWLLKNKSKPLIKNILKSQFAQIALLEACKKLKDESNNHLLWQKELLKRWQKDNKNELPDDFEMLPFVKKILNNPSEDLLNVLTDNQDE